MNQPELLKTGPVRSINIRGPITDELFAKLSIPDIVVPNYLMNGL